MKRQIDIARKSQPLPSSSALQEKTEEKSQGNLQKAGSEEKSTSPSVSPWVIFGSIIVILVILGFMYYLNSLSS